MSVPADTRPRDLGCRSAARSGCQHPAVIDPSSGPPRVGPDRRSWRLLRGVSPGQIISGPRLAEKLHGESSRSFGDHRYRQNPSALMMTRMASVTDRERVARIPGVPPFPTHVLPIHEVVEEQRLDRAGGGGGARRSTDT